MIRIFLIWILCAVFLGASDAPDFQIQTLKVIGAIDKENISFNVEMDLKTTQSNQVFALFSGDLVLSETQDLPKGMTLLYVPERKEYQMKVKYRGEYSLNFKLAARPTLIESGLWRECSFHIPVANQRELLVKADRQDLAVLFPWALQLERNEVEGLPVFTALLGPGHPFQVRWQPQVTELDSKLVVATQSNTILSAQVGVWNIDSVHSFDISQGKMTSCLLSIPENVHITRVEGAFIRDWNIRVEGEQQILQVELNREQADSYDLHIIAEQSIGVLPNLSVLPKIHALGTMHNQGHILIGSNSAIQLSAKSFSGLKQIDMSAFPRVRAMSERSLPRNILYAYEFSSDEWNMNLEMKDIVPSFDSEQRIHIAVQDDDVIVHSTIELDIRDAVMTEVQLASLEGFTLAEISGEVVNVDACHVSNGKLHIIFKEAVIGRVLINCRYEMGHSPLDKAVSMTGSEIFGARNQRGFMVLSAEDGVQVINSNELSLRQVHIGSLPLKVNNAQFAWRFRSHEWNLNFNAEKRRSGIRAEGFHLVSLGDGNAFGSLIMTYFITGAPVDELHFTLNAEVKQLEFIGSDISSWNADGQHYTVKLSKKIIGDYNLGIYWQQRFSERGMLDLGVIACDEVDTETGYMVISSRDHVQVSTPDALSSALLEIDTEELPPSYRLPINAPVLKSYKYVDGEHAVPLAVTDFAQGELIPVVIEVMEMKTTLSLRQDTGDVESLTHVIYKIKNANSQFLTLMMPEDARIWSVQSVEKDETKNITAAQDGAMVKVPLQRRRDPNEPMTIKMVYGQSHGVLAWGGELLLQAPRSPLYSTFARWHVDVPEGFMLNATDSGNMQLVRQNVSMPEPVLQRVAEAWERAFDHAFQGSNLIYAAVGAVIFFALILALHASWFPRSVLLLGFAGVVMLGFASSTYVHLNVANPPRHIVFDQALSLDQKQAMEIAVQMQQTWHFGLNITRAIIAGLISVLAIAAACILRRRKIVALLSISLAVAALGVAMQSVPACHPYLVDLCTWLAPLLLVLWVIRHLLWNIITHVIHHKTAVASMLLCSTALGGAGWSQSLGATEYEPGVIPAVTCQAEIGYDSVEVTMSFHILADKDYELPLLPLSAVLRNAEELPKYVELQLLSQHYALKFTRKGSYDITVNYLLPLPDKDLCHACTLPLPLALRNEVKLIISEPGITIESPTAIAFKNSEAEKSSHASAQFLPGAPAVFRWKPRNRNTSDEVTRMYAETINLARADSGLLEGKHRIQLRIAQGEVRELRLRIPQRSTVTEVSGDAIGAWRFDVETGICVVKLNQAQIDAYVFEVTTQMSGLKLPYAVEVHGITVLGAERNRSVLGLSASKSVLMTVDAGGVAPMHVEDLILQAQSMLNPEEELRQAFRLDEDVHPIKIHAEQVLSELRSTEQGSFSISDERLLYVAKLQAVISKTGVFFLTLQIPEGFDIDSLQSPQMSHWDDELVNGQRQVQIYLKNKIVGAVNVNLALSKPINAIPEQIDVPRVRMLGTLKHRGEIAISAERGLRLLIVDKQAVSEVDVDGINQQNQKPLHFKLLQDDWKIRLQPEQIHAVTDVKFLHDVHVTEGMLRHAWYFRYAMRNAGRKQFSVQIPLSAIGVLINAPDIARWDDVMRDGKRYIDVSLTKKYFEQNWPLTITFETRFDRSNGEVSLESMGTLESDSMKGHVVVHGSDRVEVQLGKSSEDLVATESRSIPNIFGAGSLADAAFCFKSGNGLYQILLQATRHSNADVLQAQVLSTRIDTVYTKRGECFTRAQLSLRVGKKSHLQAILPKESQIWSLRVDGVVTTPSKTNDDWLIPVAQGAKGDLPVTVELIYVNIQDNAWTNGQHRITGPRFDLPLVDIDWNIFVPPSWTYSEVKGTVTVNPHSLASPRFANFGIEAYEDQNKVLNGIDLDRARLLQEQGKQFAAQGKQYEAKQALEMACNYSYSDLSFNEDARVQLHWLNQKQAVVGIVGRRGNLRQQKGEWVEDDNNDLGDKFRIDEAERVQNSLSKADSENLEKIIDHMIRMQEDAATDAPRMMISSPLHGQVISTHRNLQIQADVPMFITFEARKKDAPTALEYGYYEAFLAALLVLGILLGAAFLESRWALIDGFFTSSAKGRLIVDMEKSEADEALLQDDEWQSLADNKTQTTPNHDSAEKDVTASEEAAPSDEDPSAPDKA